METATEDLMRELIGVVKRVAVSLEKIAAVAETEESRAAAFDSTNLD